MHLQKPHYSQLWGFSYSRRTFDAERKKLYEIYLDYVDQLLTNGRKCAIATHHGEILQEARKLVDKYNPDKAFYEFESLHGIQTEQLAKLKDEGYVTKLYFVYGTE